MTTHRTFTLLLCAACSGAPLPDAGFVTAGGTPAASAGGQAGGATGTAGGDMGAAGATSGGSAGGAPAGGASAGGAPAGGAAAGGSAGGSSAGGSGLLGDDCSTAEPVSSGATVMASTVGYRNDFTPTHYACGVQSAIGADRVYRVSVPAGLWLWAAVTPLDPTFDPAVYLVRGPAASCNAAPSCLDGDDAGPQGTTNIATWHNTTTQPAELFIVVDARSALQGPFQLQVSVAATLPGDTCDASNPITTSRALIGERLDGYAGNYTWGGAPRCATSGYAGADRAYALIVPASTAVLIEIEVTSGAWTPSLQLVSSCNANPQACRASSNAAGRSNALLYRNTSATPEPLFLIVDNASSQPLLSAYDLTVTFGPIAVPGDTCASALELDAGTLTGETLDLFANDYGAEGSTACAALPGADRVYATLVPPGRRARFTAVSTVGQDVALSVVEAPASRCGDYPRVCDARVDSTGPMVTRANTELVTYFNPSASPQRVQLIVDSAAAAGSFDLSLAFDTPPAADRCETAVTLTSGQPVSGDFTALIDDYSGRGAGCHEDSELADAVYAITVDAAQTLDVVVSPAAGLDTSISFALDVAGCNARRCVAGWNGAASGLPDTLSYTNRTPTPQTLFIIVDHGFTLGASTFTIVATLTTPPPGEMCVDATAPAWTPAVGGGAVVQGETLAGFHDDFNAGGNCAPHAAPGPDRVYRVTVPPGRTHVTVSPAASWDALVSVMAAPAATCSAPERTCITGSDVSSAGGAPETVAISNTGASPRDYFVVVDTPAAMPTTFELSRVDGPLVAGEDCATAEPLAVGAAPAGLTTAGFEDDVHGSTAGACLGQQGRDRVFKVSVPAGQRLDVAVTPDAGFVAALDLMLGEEACYARRCVAAALPSGSSGPVARWTNAGPGAVDVLVSIDSETASAGAFGITATLATPAAGETCANAIPVTNGAMVSGTSAGFSRETAVTGNANGCWAALGSDVVYSATVAAGQTFKGQLTSLTGSAIMNLIAGPASGCVFRPSCLANSGGSSVVEWRNTGSAPMQVFLVVANAQPVGPSATWTLKTFSF